MEKNTRFYRLQLANSALKFNARSKVIERITGLTQRELQRVFYDRPEYHHRSGRTHASPAWFTSVNLIVSYHAAWFYGLFRAITSRGIPPGEALVTAYEKYLARFGHDKRIDFDRAFFLITCVDGYWTTDEPALRPIECPECHGIYIGEFYDGKLNLGDCPLCRVAKSYEYSNRVKTALAHPALRDLLGVVPSLTPES